MPLNSCVSCLSGMKQKVSGWFYCSVSQNLHLKNSSELVSVFRARTVCPNHNYHSQLSLVARAKYSRPAFVKSFGLFLLKTFESCSLFLHLIPISWNFSAWCLLAQLLLWFSDKSAINKARLIGCCGFRLSQMQTLSLLNMFIMNCLLTA